MALRRKEKQLNQADRAKTGQNAPQQAGLFDLRENREEFDADYPDYPEERPYRERHRVEVDSTGSYSAGNYSARNRSAGYYDAESRENGTAGGNLSEWPGLTVSPYGEEYDRPEQRIVRGNVPASRRGTAAGVKSFEEQPQASGRSSDRDSFSAEKEQKKKNTSTGRGQARTSGRSREIRADLLAPYAASEYGSRETAQGQYGTRTARQQPRGNVRGGTRNTARQESRAGTRSTARQENRGGSGKAAERRNRSDTARNTAQTRRRNDSYYPAGNLPENHSERDSERDAAAASAERRLRQRALARKKREQQLRRFYIRTGVIALSILALVVFLIVSALKNRNGETAGPAGQGTETAQADAGTAGAADGFEVETAPGGTGTAETENTGTDTQPGESSPGTEAEGSQTQTPAEPGSDDPGAVTEPGTGDAAAGQETAEGSQAQTPGEPGNDDTGAVTE
ncbi:MAG: hypothetical protein Q4D81_11935, partial [Eubacteriales bacterium]|nr:hypothetical protein [Eubacteriales bacterium]